MNKNLLLIFFIVFSFSRIQAQLGANTPCSIQNVISLSIPSQCGISMGSTPFVGTFNNSSYGKEEHSPFFQQCNPLPTPKTDIWFKFYATSNSVRITVDSIFPSLSFIQTPQITIYQSTDNCKQPKPIKCKQGLTNSMFVQMDVNELIPLTPYYLQVSGAQVLDTGKFRLKIQPYDSCTCLKHAFLSLTPMPVAGYYPPGEKVNVCVSVLGYNSSLGNGLHAIIPDLGPGWDLSSISNITSTPTIDQQGKWSFYPTAVNTPIGPKAGFFYERNGDLNPANNLGDYGDTSDVWFFCFDIKTKSMMSCNQEEDLSIKFELFSDGETGSNPVKSCIGKNVLHSMSKLNCCLGNSVLTTTPADCNETCDGSAIINLNTSSQGPFNYEWYDGSGSQIISSGYPTNKSDTLKNACINLSGNYVVYVTDSNSGFKCRYYKAFDIFYPIWQIIPNQEFYGCVGECMNSASIGNLSTHSFNSVTWTNQLTFASYSGTPTLTDSMCAGFYKIDLIDSANACSRTYEWFLFSSPAANPFFSYPKSTFCLSDAGIRPDSIATGGGYFYSVPGGYVDSTSGTLLFNTSTPTNITIYYITGGNKCKDTSGVTITVLPSPPAPSGKATYTACSFDTLTMNVTSGGTSSNTILWYNQPYSATIAPFANGNSVQHQFFSPGTHLIYVYNETGGCRSQPFIITVTVDEGTADAGPDIEICSGNSTQFNATGGNSYLWVPSTFLSDDKSPTPTCTPDSSISYLLKVISQSTCPGYDTLNVRVINSDDCIDIKPVNAFSPNSDGVNDFWFIRGIENSENEVSIFSRWGGLVWKTKNYDNSTNTFVGKDSNGKLLAANTYFYLISINNAKYTGWIEIVR